MAAIFLFLFFLSHRHYCLRRWSRRWLPARSSKIRRTTAPRACPSCFSTRGSVRLVWFLLHHLHHHICLTLIQHVCLCSAGENISPKVLQALGNEKMKVGGALNATMAWIPHEPDLSSLWAQYAVTVTKYDRKGYKARTRQLLLTANSAIIVEEGKLKQRIDYGALKGQALKQG